MLTWPWSLPLYGRWRTKFHPDATGSMLQKLAPVLEWYMSERAAAPHCRAALPGTAGLHDTAGVSGNAEEAEYDCGVLIDAYSLYRRREWSGSRPELDSAAEASEAVLEAASYMRATSRMDEWFGHVGTVVLAMDAEPDDWPAERSFISSGWCAFECAAARMLKPPVHLLRVGKFPRKFDGSFHGVSEGNFAGAKTLGVDQPGHFADKDRLTLAKQAERKGRAETLAACAAARSQQPPIAPGAPFLARLAGKLFSLPLVDAPLVTSLYDQLASRGLGDLRRMRFSDTTNWGQDEWADLSAALSCCRQLQELDLSRSLGSTHSPLSFHPTFLPLPRHHARLAPSCASPNFASLPPSKILRISNRILPKQTGRRWHQQPCRHLLQWCTCHGGHQKCRQPNVYHRLGVAHAHLHRSHQPERHCRRRHGGARARSLLLPVTVAHLEPRPIATADS